MLAALPAALLCGSGKVHAAQPLLAELLARAPAAPGQPAMSALALEACLRNAGGLDKAGAAIVYESAAIDRAVAEAKFLEYQINAELPMLGGLDERGLNAFQQRVIRHEELAKKFKTDFLLYQERQKSYDAAVTEFGRACARDFTAADLAAAKVKLGIK